MHPSVVQKNENQTAPDQDYGGMGKHSPTKFGEGLLGSQTCVRAGTVMLNQHVSGIPVRPHSLVMLFQFLEGFDICV